MHRFDRLNIRNMLVGGAAAAFLAVSGGAFAQGRLDAHAQFCDDFDHNVIMGGKIDEASKYLTDDFKEHNARLTADGLQDFIAKLKAMRAGAAASPPAQRASLRHPRGIVLCFRPAISWD